MPAPTPVLTNVLVGSAHMYIGPEKQAAPADSLPFNEMWPAPYVYAGASHDGLTLQIDRKEQEHFVDEVDSPAIITVKATTMQVLFKFAEATLENLKFATGGGTISTQAAAVGVIGKKTLKISQKLQVVSLGFEGENPQGFYRRVVIPRVVSVGKIKAEWDRSKTKQMYSAEFKSVCSIEDCLIYDKTANAL